MSLMLSMGLLAAESLSHSDRSPNRSGSSLSAKTPDERKELRRRRKAERVARKRNR